MDNFTCKICGKDITAHSSDDLFKCGTSALKGRKWDAAEALFDQAIRKDSQEPRAYFGKLLAECECTGEEDLAKNTTNISEKESYKKAYQYGDDDFKRQLEGYNAQVAYNVACQMCNTNNIASLKSALETFTGMTDYKDSADMAEKCREKIYKQALERMTSARTEKDFSEAKSAFELIKGYSDADAKAAECAAKSDDNRSSVYQEALKLGRSDSMIDLKNAIKILEDIIDYRDAKDKLEIFKNRLEKMKDESKEEQIQSAAERNNTLQKMQDDEKKKAKQAKITKIVIIAIAVLFVLFVFIIPSLTAAAYSAEDEAVLYENTGYVSGYVSDNVSDSLSEL